MPHNLDMEISDLRRGWGEWCVEYQKLADERAMAFILLRAVMNSSHAELPGVRQRIEDYLQSNPGGNHDG